MIPSWLQAHITQHNPDITCLSEAFLNSSIQSDDDRVTIDAYNLIRSNYPNDLKKRGVYIYYKEHKPLFKLDDICTLKNCLVRVICL